ncbi:HIT family protein [Rhodococcus aerolatus]
MATLFTRIISGEIPGRFVWRDERCVVFLTINPLAPGHALVVPREEVDHWIDLPADLAAHLWVVAQHVGRAQQDAFSPSKVGVLVAGEEVPHTHVHLIPFTSVRQLEISNAEADPDPAALDDAAERLRAALRAAGHPETVDA